MVRAESTLGIVRRLDALAIMKPNPTEMHQSRPCREPGCLVRALHPESASVWQLQPGRLDGVADCRAEGPLHLLRARFSRAVRIGIDSGTSLLVVPPDRARALRVQGAEIDRHDAALCLGNEEGDEHELVLSANCALTLVQLREQNVRPRAADGDVALVIARSVAPSIRALTQSLFDHRDGGPRSRSKRDSVARTLRPIFRGGRDAAAAGVLSVADSDHAIGLIGALVTGFFRTNECPSVEEMSRLTGYSRRTLTYAFQKRYGVPPKRFFRTLALKEVRQALINSQGEARVSAVAPFFGFCHMGQFSADYRSFFGELPSQTLERARARARRHGASFEPIPSHSAVQASF